MTSPVYARTLSAARVGDLVLYEIPPPAFPNDLPRYRTKNLVQYLEVQLGHYRSVLPIQDVETDVLYLPEDQRPFYLGGHSRILVDGSWFTTTDGRRSNSNYRSKDPSRDEFVRTLTAEEHVLVNNWNIAKTQFQQLLKGLVKMDIGDPKYQGLLSRLVHTLTEFNAD